MGYTSTKSDNFIHSIDILENGEKLKTKTDMQLKKNEKVQKVKISEEKPTANRFVAKNRYMQGLYMQRLKTC